MSVRRWLVLAVALGVVIGCGGGGGAGAPVTDGSTNGGTDTGGVAAPQGTAHFRVDVETGEVRVTDLQSSSRAIFSGGLVTFQSTTLIDEPGNTGRKVLNVTMANKSGQPIGMNSDGNESGIRVLLSAFKNIDSTTDLRTLTRLTTISGSTLGYQDGPVGTALFNRPASVVAASDGTVYVADTDNNRIRKISMGQVSTLAGSGSSTSIDGSGVAATLYRPYGLAIGPDNYLYVTELLGRRVRRISPSGVVTTVAGTGAVGGADGSGSTATFNAPEGLAAGPDGSLYVADSLNHKIRKILPAVGDPRLAASYNVTTLAGSGAAAFADGVGAGASFNAPRALTVASDGTVYVADRLNHRLRRVSPNGEVVTIVGKGIASAIEGTGDVATVAHPGGIAATGDGLLFYDGGTKRLRQAVLKSGQAPGSPASWKVSNISGTGATGFVDGTGDVAQMSGFGSVSWNDGQLLFADGSNNAIRTLTSNAGLPVPDQGGSTTTEKVTLVDSDGFETANLPGAYDVETPYLMYAGGLEAGASASPRKWQFSVPEGVKAFEFIVTVSAETGFYSGLDAGLGVASANNYVRTIAGRSLGGLVDGQGSVARFGNATGLGIDDQGILYVADTNNHAIRRIDAAGNVSTVVGGGGIGSTDGYGNAARLNNPNGVACSADGTRLYIADSGNYTIRLARMIGSDPSQAGSWLVSTIAGAATVPGYVENADGATTRLNAPLGIAVMDGQSLVFSEAGGNRIRRLKYMGGDESLATSWRSYLVAGNTTAPGGTPGNTNGNGSTARFDNPAHIAVDRLGNIYVADTNNHRIRKVDPDGDVTTLAGSSYGYADGTGVAAQFAQPFGIGVDEAGYVFVSEFGHMIRRVSPSGVVRTVAGTSGIGFPEQDGPGTSAYLYYPIAIAMRGNGELYFLSGGTYPYTGGGSVSSPGLKVKLIERLVKK
ncbi:MAG: hypothetical protein ACAH95_18495 [Fimbriimonas sp.]